VKATTDWMAHAECSGLEYPNFTSDDREELEVARQVCMSCPVIKECLDVAVKIRAEVGVWGGLMPEQVWEMVVKREPRGRRGWDS
jgi:WhiB family transcriptional regulator, redox-sensing transcriptional regulator